MQRLRDLFQNLPIKFKLLVGYSSIFAATLLLGSLVIYSLVRDTIRSNIESELKNTTITIRNMVHTAARNSIRSYLRGVAEANLDLVQNIFNQYQSGLLDKSEAMARAAYLLKAQTIGNTGYIYCVDSHGVAQIHPNPGVAGRNFMYRRFVKEQIKRKEGYLEYEWQNPGEKAKRPKALYMTYFEPWDWIISVSSYRDDFRKLVKVSDFRERILSLKFGKTGYCYMVDSKGNLLVHPLLKGNQLEVTDDRGHNFLKDIIAMKTGKLTYSWKNPGEKKFRQKLVIFNYIPEFDWIVAASCYLEESFAPLVTVRNIVIATAAGTLLLVLPITLLISTSISRPLKTLMNRFSAAAAGDLTVRVEANHKDELGQLGAYFNNFMDRLAGSQRLEREILEISEREHQKIGRDLHDDLCPHLIGIEVLTNVLEKKLEGQGSPQAENAAKIKNLVNDSINKLRRLSKGLCPLDLGEHGLDSALSELATQVEEVFGVSCRLICEQPVTIKDQNLVANIYYIVHEAVHNAVKHAKAAKITIHLSLRGERLLLRVEDDGCGLSPPKDSRGMGLSIMRYRAHRIGARLEMRNRPGKGTTVNLELGGLDKA